MINVTGQLADLLTEHQIELLRVSAHQTQQVYKLLQDLQRELLNRLTAADLSAEQARRLSKVLDEVRAAIRSTYSEINRTSISQLVGLGSTEGRVMASLTNTVFGVELLDGVLPRGTLRTLITDALIQGAPSKQWWARQAGDVLFRFSQQMRLGIAAGETNADLVRRTKEVMQGVTRRNAEALVRTSAQTVANLARLETFRVNADVIKGVQQVSTLDDRTTEICMAYDGAAWDLEGEPLEGTTLPFNGGPPRHWNCRSVLVPITKSFAELGVAADEVPAGTRASADGQVSTTVTFNDWFGKRSIAAQNRILGTGKAQLWRDGKISMTDLLDQSGNPLSLEQLNRKYG